MIAILVFIIYHTNIKGISLRVSHFKGYIINMVTVISHPITTDVAKERLTFIDTMSGFSLGDAHV